MRKPDAIKYGLTERPPLPSLLFLGLQQIFVLASYFSIILIIYRAGNASEVDISHAISTGMIALAIGSVLQVLWRGPVGSGFLALPVVSAIYLAASILAIHKGGTAGLMTMTIFAGICEIIFCIFIQYLRFLFTGAVTGLVILLVGFEIAQLGLNSILGLDQSVPMTSPWANFFAASATIVTMIIITIWSRGVWRLFPIILGLAIGSICASILGVLTESPLEVIKNTSLFAVPTLPSFSFHFIDHAIFPFIFAAIASALLTMGTIITAQSLNDADWTHSDFKAVKKGVAADGISSVISGFLGTPGLTVSPTSVAVSSISGATSRYIAFAAAGMLIALSFFPIFANLFLLIPVSVIGGALLYNGAFMMLGGIKLMTSRNLDTRAILVVGISFTLGTSRLIFPQYYMHLPTPLNLLASSSLSIAGFSAIVLTLLFRLGIHSHIKMEKSQTNTMDVQQFSAILEQRLKALSIQDAIIKNAVEAADKLVTELIAEEVDLTKLDFQIDYDQVTLKLIFNFPGKLVKFAVVSNTNNLSFMQDQAAYGGLEKLFAVSSVDNVSSLFKNGQSQITLSFFI